MKAKVVLYSEEGRLSSSAKAGLHVPPVAQDYHTLLTLILPFANCVHKGFSLNLGCFTCAKRALLYLIIHALHKRQILCQGFL